MCDVTFLLYVRLIGLEPTQRKLLIGLEPTQRKLLDPKSSASTNFATGACFRG